MSPVANRNQVVSGPVTHSTIEKARSLRGTIASDVDESEAGGADVTHIRSELRAIDSILALAEVCLDECARIQSTTTRGGRRRHATVNAWFRIRSLLDLNDED